MAEELMTPEGKQFHDALRTCLKYMALGGELKLKSGHTLAIHTNGEPGFVATRTDNSSSIEEQILFQIGSDTAWLFLVDFAKKMTEIELFSLYHSVALTEIRRGKNERK